MIFLATETKKQPTPDLLVNGQTPKVPSTQNQTLTQASSNLPTTTPTKTDLEVRLPQNIPVSTQVKMAGDNVLIPPSQNIDVLGISLSSQDFPRTQNVKPLGNNSDYLYIIGIDILNSLLYNI